MKGGRSAVKGGRPANVPGLSYEIHRCLSVWPSSTLRVPATVGRPGLSLPQCRACGWCLGRDQFLVGANSMAHFLQRHSSIRPSTCKTLVLLAYASPGAWLAIAASRLSASSCILDTAAFHVRDFVGKSRLHLIEFADRKLV